MKDDRETVTIEKKTVTVKNAELDPILANCKKLVIDSRK